MEAATCWLASAFTVVESAVCIVISDCDCDWLLASVAFPPQALGCVDDDCPALDGASLGLRGNKLAFNDGCIANSRKGRKFQLKRHFVASRTYLALWSWRAVEIHVHSVRLCCLLAARWRRDGRRPAMALFLRRACIQANVRLMQSLRVAYELGIPAETQEADK